MTHRLPGFAPHHLTLLSFGFGLLAGLTALEATAAPTAPVASIITSAVTRFADNGNGTITDSLTGLIWLKNANCFGVQTWAAALSSANNLASGNCGLTDGSTAGKWRLPNVNEWQSLVDYTRVSPTLPVDHPFAGVQSYYYWSSTTDASDTDGAWVVFLGDGGVYWLNKAVTGYVWPVRGGQ